MSMRTVKIRNEVNKTISIKKPQYNVNRRWTAKGQIIPIPYDAVEQMLWDQGVRNMIDRGMLSIVDLQDAIDLGLEPEGVTERVNIKILSDIQIENLLKNIPFAVFKNEVQDLTSTQVKEIVNYAILHDIADVQKSEFLKELTGVDVLKAIVRNKEVEEREKNEK